MIYGDIADFLSTFIDYDELNEAFDYDAFESGTLESYKKELHKFNHLYKCYFFNKDRLVFMINNYEIILKKDLLSHLIKMYLYFKKNDRNNSFLIAEFLLSYYNSIKSKQYVKNVPDSKNIMKEFREIVLSNKELNNPIIEFSDVSYKLYDMIVEHKINRKNFFVGEMIERACSNLKHDDGKRQKLVNKLLKNQILPLRVIEFDNKISNHVSYYEKYIKSMLSNNTYYQYPEKIIYELDKINKLKTNLFNLILNNLISKINGIQDRAFNSEENFIQILAETDEIIQILNKFLNKLKNINDNQRKKLRECLNNTLYIKRIVVSDDNKIYSQTQEFAYNTSIPNKKVNEFVEMVENKLGTLYSCSCGNFVKKLEDSLNIYSEHPVSYIFNSFNIDSENQVYYKSDDLIEESVFKQYYDSKGMEYTKLHPELQNKLSGDYYNQMLKYLRHQFISEQYFILSFFNICRGDGSLIKLLMSKGEFLLNNKYVVLAMNTMQIEHIIIEILKKRKKHFSKSGSLNLNELAQDNVDDDSYFNGLMYINYILYEKQGLNIRNNVAHGNYFKKNIEVELMTTFSAIMFLNTIYRKECDMYDQNK